MTSDLSTLELEPGAIDHLASTLHKSCPLVLRSRHRLDLWPGWTWVFKLFIFFGSFVRKQIISTINDTFVPSNNTSVLTVHHTNWYNKSYKRNVFFCSKLYVQITFVLRHLSDHWKLHNQILSVFYFDATDCLGGIFRSNCDLKKCIREGKRTRTLIKMMLNMHQG